MCFDPISMALMIGGAALSAGGGAISANDADRNAAAVAKARNRVLNDTLARNERHAQQARQSFDARVADAGPAQAPQKLDQAKADRTAQLESTVQPLDTGTMPTADSAPTVIKSALAKAMLEASSAGKAAAQRSGRLGGYGDFFFDRSLGDNAASRDIGVSNNLAQGNLSIMPYLQDFAGIAAQKKPGILGPLLSGLGSAASMGAGVYGKGLTTPSPAGAAGLLG